MSHFIITISKHFLKILPQIISDRTDLYPVCIDYGGLRNAVVFTDYPQILVTKHNETLFLCHILGSLRVWLCLYPPRYRLIEPHL